MELFILLLLVICYSIIEHVLVSCHNDIFVISSYCHHLLENTSFVSGFKEWNQIIFFFINIDFIYLLWGFCSTYVKPHVVPLSSHDIYHTLHVLLSKGVIKSRKSKDRQYNGQKDRQCNGQKDRQCNGQKDRQYNGQNDKRWSTKHYTEN